ncbi:MAG TPA: glucan ABC transporter ATP-binding protein/ permease [Polyangiales bacterium]|nr:glucan ABC transporter ATP-binding protein/ permease [Polyangiales bacterium]
MLRTYARVLGQLRPRRRLAVALSFGNLVLAVAHFAEPVLFGRVVDALSRASAPAHSVRFTELLPLIGAWLGFGLIGIVGGVAVAFHADLLSHRLRLAVIAHYFEHVLSLPLGFHLNAHSGRLMKVMSSGADAMWMLWLGFFREHCAALVSLCVLLPLTLFLNVWLGLLLCALVLGFAIAISTVVRKTQDAQSHVGKFHTRLVEHTSDALGNLPVIQSFTRVQAELGSLRSISQQLLEAQLPVLSFWAVTSIASRAAATLTVCTVLTAGTWLILRDQLTLGELVTFISLATMLITRLDGTLTFVAALFQESSKLRDFFEVLDTEPSVRDAPDAREAGTLSGEVVFEDVAFSYDGTRNAVDGVSFVARAGETIALVGATGSGKSTTLSLLYRAFDPIAGRVCIDGQDVRRYTLDSLRRNIAIVFQEPMLFARSLRENLLLGRPDASDAELREALGRAQALEIVDALPDGLGTPLSERGRSLSGGERQRIAIARALLKAPPILVLDEPTAALDAATEHKLKVALEEVVRGRTTFVIAHRLATIRNADRILVLDRGRIVESGRYEELVARDGRFAELARAQFMAAS